MWALIAPAAKAPHRHIFFFFFSGRVPFFILQHQFFVLAFIPVFRVCAHVSGAVGYVGHEERSERNARGRDCGKRSFITLFRLFGLHKPCNQFVCFYFIFRLTCIFSAGIIISRSRVCITPSCRAAFFSLSYSWVHVPFFPLYICCRGPHLCDRGCEIPVSELV